MKVSELIAELQKYDPEQEIFVYDRLYGYDGDILVGLHDGKLRIS